MRKKAIVELWKMGRSYMEWRIIHRREASQHSIKIAACCDPLETCKGRVWLLAAPTFVILNPPFT